MAKQTPYGKILAQWQIQEYEKYYRGFLWYLIMGGGGLALFIYAIWTFNFLFALIIIIIATIIVLHERKEPDILTFIIAEDGIILENTFIPYKDIQEFRIIYEPPQIKNLYFKTNRTLRPELSIPLINMNPVIIRRILIQYIDEDLEDKDMSTDDQMSRILKI